MKLFSRAVEGIVTYYKDKECTIVHREGAPAIEYENGTKFWYINGQPHRKDGPAIEWVNGHKEWWINGMRHREDGPAYIDNNNRYKEYWLRGHKFSKENFKIEIEKMRFGNFV